MTCKDELLLKVADLLFLSHDGGISDEQFVKFETLLQDNPLAREYYFDLLLTTVGLNEAEGILSLAERGLLLGDVGSPLWQILAETEKTSPEIPVKKPIEKSVEPELAKIEKPVHKISRFSIFTLTFSAAAMLLLMVIVLLSPTRPIVATLTDSIDAEWEGKKAVPINGDVLRQGTMYLASGLVEITFDYGAHVVIEGPAEFELESPDKMILLRGNIYATVPEYATGFMVQTPYSTILDLGTEFGLKVDQNGETEIHMIKGLSSLIPGQKGKAKKGQILNAGQARHIDTSGQVRQIQVSTESLARHICSKSGFILRGDTISLADMVGGGDGTGSGTIGRGISLESGRFVYTNNNNIEINYSKTFTKVDGIGFVDSVFIPDGSREEVIISSTGMKFEGFPNTSGRSTDSIYNQGDTIYYAMGSGTRSCLTVIDGKRYGNQSNPAIYMHSNAGITFDLNAIRSLIGDSIAISGFKVLCGVPDGIDIDQKLGTTNLDFWVLVDGRQRFKHLNMQAGSPAETVDIPLHQSDRFLTLVVTAGGNGIAMDLALFADPVLVFSCHNE